MAMRQCGLPPDDVQPFQTQIFAAMTRPFLEESSVHPAIRQHVSEHHRDIVQEVQDALVLYPVVVVGMSGNPVCTKARKRLDQAGIAHHYLEYGSYFSQWRRRNALKMWTGWPTFPMVFAKGMLLGGDSDLATLMERGELQQLLA
jgi:monothiol glutaredoxin